MNILFSFFYLLHHLNFSSPFQRFLKIFNDYIFSHTWQTKAIIDHSKEAPTLTHYQVFLNFIHISASPWLSRTDPCFPFLSARGLATVWKLTTGEKGLQPNLFCDLGMVTMVIMIIMIIMRCYLTISPYTVLLPRPMMVYLCSPSVLKIFF